MQQGIEEQLRELLVFTDPPTTFGLPRGLFWNLTLISSVLAIQGAWWAGLLVFVLTFAPLYRAHRMDPRAAAVWRTALVERVGGITPTVPKTTWERMRGAKASRCQYLKVRFEP